MREWLTVIVVLLIVGILLDGWRRMRHSRQNSIRMSLSMHQGTEKKDLEVYGSELPNGGARVVAKRDPQDSDNLNRVVREGFQVNEVSEGKHSQIPEQVALNLDESVPMLMDVEPQQEREESQQEAKEPQDPGVTFESGTAAEARIADSPIAERPIAENRIEPSISDISAAPPQDRSEPELSLDDAEEVLVINVMAANGKRFNGNDLLDVILSCGMRFGAMHIFHRHQDEQGEGPVLFSMANIVKPGTFDLNAMDHFETPGVSLFMTLPLEGESIRAFDLMANTAKTLCEQLGGELKDENRSVMTQQTMEHCRQRIREFERKQLSRV